MDKLIEAVAKAIYEQWSYHPEYVPWVDYGNSLKQGEARMIAREVLTTAGPYQVVPVEPTTKMKTAGWMANDETQGCFNHEHGDVCPYCEDGFKHPDGCGNAAVASYRAMLAAARDESFTSGSPS